MATIRKRRGKWAVEVRKVGYPKIIYSYADHYNIDCLLDFNGIKCEYRASTNQQDFPEFLKIDGLHFFEEPFLV